MAIQSINNYQLAGYQIRLLRDALIATGLPGYTLTTTMKQLRNIINSDAKFKIMLEVINEYSNERRFILKSREKGFECDFYNGHTIDSINLQSTVEVCNADIIYPKNNAIADFKHTENMWKDASRSFGWASNSGFTILKKHVDKYHQQGINLNKIPWLVVLIDDKDTQKQFVFVNINEAMDILKNNSINNYVREVNIKGNQTYAFNKNNWYNQQYFWNNL